MLMPESMIIIFAISYFVLKYEPLYRNMVVDYVEVQNNNKVSYFGRSSQNVKISMSFCNV